MIKAGGLRLVASHKGKLAKGPLSPIKHILAAVPSSFDLYSGAKKKG